MYAYVRTLAALSAVVLLVLFAGTLADQGKAWAQFDFTFTSQETVLVITVGDTAMFYAILENTGSEIDSYYVTLTENPPTPEEWWVEFCAGGVCWDSTISAANSYLEPGWTDQVELHVLARTAEQGDFTITVDSYLNPGAKMTKSINFLMSAHEQGPVTDQWGLIILTMLILMSGLYLMYRRLKLAKQT
jgi:uncharacterized membrane protein